MTEVTIAPVDIESLRATIRAEYPAVAEHPNQGFHFHTGAHLAAILGYPEEWIASTRECRRSSDRHRRTPSSLVR